MHVLLIEPSYYTRYPPLGLLKISAWHKMQGNTVQFLRGTAELRYLVREPQRIYITSLFTWAWRPVHETVKLCKMLFPRSEILLGGVYASLIPDHAKESGADVVHDGIIPEVEDVLPDYSIVPDWHNKKKASIFFTHRGCIRRCQFCAVPFLEGKPRQIRLGSTIQHLIHPEHNRVILWDNNILGQPNWRDVIDELKELNVIVDFNQGLDARLIKEEVADYMRGMKMPIVRIAYDFPQMGRSVKKAIDYLTAAGFYRRKITSYVLFNFNDTPQDLFNRVRDLINWGATAYPMRYQPLDALEKDQYVSPQWNAEQLDMVATARRVIGFGGAFPPYEGLVKKFNEAKNFEEAFGLYRTKEEVRAAERRQTLRGQMALFSEMAEDHEWPIAKA